MVRPLNRFGSGRPFAVVLFTCMTALVIAGIGALPAAAEPATSLAYPAGSTATRFTGYAFDTCTAPPFSTISAWNAGAYRAVGAYIGGASRTCAQPELTAAWVAAVSRISWKIIPIYKGLQPPCGARPRDPKISLSPAGALTQGMAAGSDAIAKAKVLGMIPGSALYVDIENYSTTDVPCRTAVLKFVSGFVKELHASGYLAGVYANLSSGAKHLSDAYNSAAFARPDALWVARFDNNPSLFGLAGIPDANWAVHQRARQYRGDHNETIGGVTLNVDSNRFDAPVATVAYTYRVTSSTTLNARSGPAASYPVRRTYAPGAALRVACQTTGSRVGTTGVWDQLADGTYVTDFYVSTASNTGFTGPLPRCYLPYQVNATDGAVLRTGPGNTFAAAGRLPNGSLAWIVCQRSGSRVGTSAIWNQLDNARWVSDAMVATPSSTTFSSPLRRC